MKEVKKIDIWRIWQKEKGTPGISPGPPGFFRVFRARPPGGRRRNSKEVSRER